jgi:hypothetical protein
MKTRRSHSDFCHETWYTSRIFVLLNDTTKAAISCGGRIGLQLPIWSQVRWDLLKLVSWIQLLLLLYSFCVLINNRPGKKMLQLQIHISSKIVYFVYLKKIERNFWLGISPLVLHVFILINKGCHEYFMSYRLTLLF